MPENENDNVKNAVARVEEAASKAVSDIIAAHAEHKNMWEAMKTEFETLSHAFLDKVETAIGDDTPITSLTSELENIAESEIEPEVLISIAVRMVKRAATLDPNAKTNFEKAYESA